MTESSPLLRLDRVCAGYGGATVLHDVSLTVGEGELVALLGPNGAGKSTTVMVIAGLVAPSSGAVEVLEGAKDSGGSNGGSPTGPMMGDSATPPRRYPLLARNHRSATALRRAHRGLAVVPDDRGLFSDLTVAENLRLGRRSGRAARSHKGRGSLDDDQIFEWFPALVDLQNRKAGLLSGGEQQILALARALVGRPRLLVIDEMSMGLAPLVIESLLDVVRRIATETGTGVMIVEQYVSLALAAADRGYVLRRGRVVMEGAADELAQDTERVAAGYLG